MFSNKDGGVGHNNSKGEYQHLELSSHSSHNSDNTGNEDRFTHSPVSSIEQVRQRHTSNLKLEVPDDIENIDIRDESTSPLANLPVVYSLFNRDVKEIIDGITKQQTVMLIILFGLTVMVLVNFTLLVSGPLPSKSQPASYDNEGSFAARKIAFGSCSSYDLRDMNIFTDAIIPSKPDAWIWTGDFVYLDDAEINCEKFQPGEDWQQSCNCSATWFASPPYSCHAGDANYASARWIKGASNGKLCLQQLQYLYLIQTWPTLICMTFVFVIAA